MTSGYKTIGFSFIATVFFFLLFNGNAFALENGNSWRPVYDIILMWINFGIIVFLVVKFGKDPLMNFLHGQKEDIAVEIGSLEEKKQKITAQVKKTRDEIEKSSIALSKLKEKILKQGEKEKEKIIQNANEQGRLMLDSAKQKIDSYIKQSKDAFRSELIDAAFDLAMEKIPCKITDEDNEKLLDRYLNSIPDNK